MITSSQNPKIQAVRALLGRNRERRDSGLFVIEGVRLAEEALASGWQVQQACYCENLNERGMQIIGHLAEIGVIAQPVTSAIMRSLTDTETSQGILLILSMRSIILPQFLDFVIIADAIRDPGNLGTLLRSAWAASAQAVILTHNSTDAFAPKVLRAGMGAHFHLPILALDWPSIFTLLKNRPYPLEIFVAESSGGASLWETDLRKPCALVIGNETEGPSPEAFGLADAHLHIPMPGNSESLNAAAAAAILLFEVVRQRRSSFQDPHSR